VKNGLSFRPRELKGSRLRCLVATSLGGREVARFLNGLVEPHAQVTTADAWQPHGFLNAGEARLGEAVRFLDAGQREVLTSWWLSVRANERTHRIGTSSARVALAASGDWFSSKLRRMQVNCMERGRVLEMPITIGPSGSRSQRRTMPLVAYRRGGVCAPGRTTNSATDSLGPGE
jgi:hypothetical protein